jgi:hypothetical protein
LKSCSKRNPLAKRCFESEKPCITSKCSKGPQYSTNFHSLRPAKR